MKNQKHLPIILKEIELQFANAYAYQNKAKVLMHGIKEDYADIMKIYEIDTASPIFNAEEETRNLINKYTNQ